MNSDMQHRETVNPAWNVLSVLLNTARLSITLILLAALVILALPLLLLVMLAWIGLLIALAW